MYLRLKDSYFVRLKQASSIQSCLSGILAMQDENHFSVPRGVTYLEHAAWFCYFQPKFLFKSRHVYGRGFMQDLILQSLTIEPSRHNRFDHKIIQQQVLISWFQQKSGFPIISRYKWILVPKWRNNTNIPGDGKIAECLIWCNLMPSELDKRNWKKVSLH